MADTQGIRLSLHGPGVTIEDAIEAGSATKELLASVAESMGVPDGAIEWAIASVSFKCDGCGLQRPDRPEPDEGWTHSDGDDFCPACTAAAVPQSRGLTPSGRAVPVATDARLDAPTMDETAAVLSAAETFHKKLHPRQPRVVRDLGRLLDELIASAQRVRAVVTGPDESNESELSMRGSERKETGRNFRSAGEGERG